ncbi:MAG TPA: pyridoxamine 5'-phosphate oxidase family protein [Actinomycetota bacterium]|nr:pyridoxamine 5'-phosphate oxidase family protein [Actinomycetota bacterium]
MDHPAASRPHIPGYGLPETDDGLMEWNDVEARLTESKHYWFATTSPGGKPHVNPIWGVWVNGMLYSGGGPDVRWAKNLDAEPRIAVHLEDGEEAVILEGRAERTSSEDDEEVIAVKAAYKAKYGFDHPAPFWRITPALAFAWTRFDKDATRFKF